MADANTVTDAVVEDITHEVVTPVETPKEPEVVVRTPVLVKTGECYYRDETGQLWLSESFVDDDNDEVSTQDTLVVE